MSDYKALYPFTSHHFDFGGVKMHYLDEGARSAPPVVMVHGNPTWSFYYRTLVPEISKTHRVIVPDHVGCGLSDKPQDYTYTLEQHIRNLEALIAHLELQNVTLILHDWGGAIAWRFAMFNQDKVNKLVICNLTHPTGYATVRANATPEQKANTKYIENFQDPDYHKKP